MLDSGKIKNSLDDYFRSYSGTPYEQARKLLSAYASYAASAQSCAGGSPVITNTETAAGIFAAALIASIGNPAAWSQGLANAIDVFWTSPPVVFPHAFPGTVVSPPGTIAATALPMILAAMASAQAWALAGRSAEGPTSELLGTALDAATRTVVVLHPIVPTPCGLTLI